MTKTIILLTVIITLITPKAFAKNRVLSLDGEGDYVEIKESESLNAINSQVTMEAWFKVKEFRSQWMPIIYKGDMPDWDNSSYDSMPHWNNRSYSLWLDCNYRRLLLDSASSSQTPIRIWSAVDSIALDTWYHVVGVIDGKSSVMKIFLNGDEVANGIFGRDIRMSSFPLRIGWTHEEEKQFSPFAGQIDEVRIWNIARAEGEIQATMHTTLSGKEPGLVGYWRFDDIDDKIATDSSPNHSDGKLIGDAHLLDVEFPASNEFVALWGMITTEAGQSIPNAAVRLEQDGEKITQTQTDASGNYRIVIFRPDRGLYDLSAVSGELGTWRLGISPSDGERQKLNLTLKKAISIEGTLLMLDYATPHVAVPVQACLPSTSGRGAGGESGKVIAGTLSDESGKYQFINLKPGKYQVRCQVLSRYVYYSSSTNDNRMKKWKDGRMGGNSHPTFQPSNQPRESGETVGETLQVEKGKTFSGIDFRFPLFKKGTWQTYTTLDGLASNIVCAIHHDLDGVMWFGTMGGGISRYDGKQFLNLTQKDGLANNAVLSLYCDADSVMWIGTFGGGVSRYDGKQFLTFTQKDGLGSNTIGAIYRDRDGNLWFGTGIAGDYSLMGGVSRYDGKELKTFTTKDGLAGGEVGVIHQDSDGVMWFGTTYRGVSRYDGKQFQTFNRKDGLAGSSVVAIHSDPDGMLWFGCSGGVSRYNRNQILNLTTEDGLTSNDINTIYRDPDGIMWFGTGSGSEAVGNGVSRYDGKTFVNFTAKDGLANNSVEAIYRDPDGVMWFGTWGGLSSYDDKSFVNFTTQDGLTHNDVRAIYRDADGVLWFGTEGNGVSRYDGKTFQNLTTQDGLVNNDVRSIHQTPDGALWFAGRWGGVSRYDGQKFHNFTKEDGLGHNAVWTIHGDPDGTLWFGTVGVSRYDGKEFKTFTTKDGLGHDWVNSIHRAPDGMMWFGTFAGGVSRYDGKQFLTFTTEDGLPSNFVSAIYGDLDGIMWFGTWGGLSRYDGKEFQTFTQKDGLADNRVLAIHRDRAGVLWCGTNGGVSRYDGITWTSLDTRDGLAGDNVYSIHEDADGSLWFGTDGGVTRYRRSTTPPKVRIVSVKTDKEYTDLEALPPITTGDRITITYNAIDFKTVPDKRQYRYRIEGIDSEWHPPTKETLFDSFFDKPGTYTFEVQAIDRDVNYSLPASVTFHVQRPLWVYAFVGMLIAGIPLTVGAFYLGKRLQTQRAIAQQFNPYIAGRVVGEDLFYGRNDLITDIERTLHNNCFLLYGERRIGKTSLQYQLRERLHQAEDPTYRFIPAYIDLQGVAEEDFFRTIAAGVVEQTVSWFTGGREALGLRLEGDLINHLYSYRDLTRDLRTIIDHLQENPPSPPLSKGEKKTKTIKLVLLMDEVDTLNSYSLRTNLNLRGLFMGPLKENLVLVMSGLYLKTDWSDQGAGSPPFNFLSREIQIQPLDEASARQLITEPVKGFYSYEPKAIVRIIELSELRPFTIQGFCLRAVNRVLADGRTRITVDDIEAIKESVLAEVRSIRGERSGTSLPASLNEALARLAALEAELAQARQPAA